MEKMLGILNDLRTAEPFRPMTREDWHGFAGADPGTYITEGGQYIFLLSPAGSLAVVADDGNEINLVLEVVSYDD
jgi:hypothetical protein